MLKTFILQRGDCESQMNLDKVSAANFYKDKGDKIKLNWFLYEYANHLYMKIEKNLELTRYREIYTSEEISTFCIYFSKRLRQSVNDAQTGHTKGVVLHGKYIYEFYPNNTYAMTQNLLDTALLAWEEQLKSCSCCPNNCLSDAYEITDMFDKLEETGWPV